LRSFTLKADGDYRARKERELKACAGSCDHCGQQALISSTSTGARPIIRWSENKKILTLLGGFTLTLTTIPVG
jgi:hypothetical protein